MYKAIARFGLVPAALILAASFALAQPQAGETSQQSTSPADAARKTREQKKADAKSRVWDNDNISIPAGGIEVVGPDANAAAPDANGASGDATGQPAAGAPAMQLSPAELAQAQAALQEAQEKQADLRQQIDLDQRKYNLDAAMFYSKPDFSGDKDGQKAINNQKGSLDSEKQDLKLTEQMVAELQRKLGLPAAKSPETKAPKPLVTAAGLQIPNSNPPAQETKPADTAATVATAPEVKPPAAKTPDAKAPADTKSPDTKAPETTAPEAKPPDAKPPAAQPEKPKPNPAIHCS